MSGWVDWQVSFQECEKHPKTLFHEHKNMVFLSLPRFPSSFLQNHPGHPWHPWRQRSMELFQGETIATSSPWLSCRASPALRKFMGGWQVGMNDIWHVSEIIPKWPSFRLVKYYNLPRFYGGFL